MKEYVGGNKTAKLFAPIYLWFKDMGISVVVWRALGKVIYKGGRMSYHPWSGGGVAISGVAIWWRGEVKMMAGPAPLMSTPWSSGLEDPRF